MSANPLAALFALKMQEKPVHPHQENDRGIEDGMAHGKLRSKSQLKLVMGIKRQFEIEMQQKEIMRKMGMFIRNIAEERADM